VTLRQSWFNRWRDGGEYNEWEDDHEKRATAEEQRSPILSRGWVLQERLLSPRVLYFGKYRIYWECNEHCRYENLLQPSSRFSKIGDREVSKPLFMKVINMNDREGKAKKLQMWYNLVADYTKHKLTISSDTLGYSFINLAKRSRLLYCRPSEGRYHP
jgi:hypothetical protein